MKAYNRRPQRAFQCSETESGRDSRADPKAAPNEFEARKIRKTFRRARGGTSSILPAPSQLDLTLWQFQKLTDRHIAEVDVVLASLQKATGASK